MRFTSNFAFKEWAVVVDALGRGEQILILRKGGIRETQGEFHVEHTSFWLFPTQYHEAESSVIPSKRPALREIATAASKDNVDIEFCAVVEHVVTISDAIVVERLQGRHIWAEPVLKERFQFGREPGLHALIVRVHRLDRPERFALREEYGGCKSWIQLERVIDADVVPVLTGAAILTLNVKKSVSDYPTMPSLIHKRPDGSDKKLEFGSKPIIVGRLPESEIQVRDTFISRVHCGIGYVNNQFILKDLGSTNGTYRNGARVFECNLSSGDKIQVGNTTLMFEVDKPSGDGVIRQIPQMVAPPRTLGAPSPPKPGERSDTIQVKPPPQTPPGT